MGLNMIPRCAVCGSREITTHYLSSLSGKLYCSKDCMLIANSRRLISVSVAISIVTFTIGIFLLVLILSEDLYSLIEFPILVFALGLAFGITLSIQGLKGRNLRKERDLESENIIYACIFCRYEYDKRIYGAPTICRSCGKESPFCDICYEYIFDGKSVYQIQNCGHVFHKSDLLDYLENEEICPKCKQKISSIDLEIK